ncbi:hypothetical protein G7046_g7236 [Stylonectria norvegica]|nr:hypothetical protein G7046_g7236 [Stylonectria norvegica]
MATRGHVWRAPQPPPHQDIFECHHNFVPATSQKDASPRGMLQELSIGNVQNRPDPDSAALASAFEKLKLHSPGPPEAKSIKAKLPSRGPRRRATIEAETFQPLDAVPEELSDTTATSIRSSNPSGLDVESSAAVGSPQPPRRQLLGCSSQDLLTETHPLLAAEPQGPRRQQIVKHLAGQFEWLISCPPSASSVKNKESRDENGRGRARGTTFFGCNLLSRRRRSASQKINTGCPLADTYTLIATPLDGNAYYSSYLDTAGPQAGGVEMAVQPPPYEQHQTTPLKVPGVVEVIEQAVSPALTFVSERDSSVADVSPRGGSSSVPRIEDSLEELDKLEEELEAINAVTNSRRVASPIKEPKLNRNLEPLPEAKKSSLSKRASFAGQSATVRTKNSDKTRPSIRRSASLIFRNAKDEESQSSPKPAGQVSGRPPLNFHPSIPRGPVKSTKPPTVPKFELPGEAVSRRLKEQREARRAQQAEAQEAEVRKAYVRPRSRKPLPKPTFELPGEAISRKKRADHEARLKATEEEERKRRDFKARPVRLSVAPVAEPRATITSRARQNRASQNDDGDHKADVNKSKRLSVSDTRGSISTRPSQSRGRLSNIPSIEDLSRATSTSTGSVSGKRIALSADEAQQLKLRGKEIFTRDNTRFTLDKAQEKKERETMARDARMQAAERTRAASRDWAEKKRQKDQALREAMAYSGR